MYFRNLGILRTPRDYLLSSYHGSSQQAATPSHAGNARVLVLMRAGGNNPVLFLEEVLESGHLSVVGEVL